MASSRTKGCFFLAYFSLIIFFLIALYYYYYASVLHSPKLFTIVRTQPQQLIADLIFPKNSEEEFYTLFEEVGAIAYKEQDSCDIFDGSWVVDDSGPRYEPGSCPVVDDHFDCFKNGRLDSNYTRWRWQPKECNLPRIEGEKMLEMLRGKRLAFVGDSLNRNMWQSLVCILRNSLQNKSRVKKDFKGDNAYLFIFSDYNCSVEFFQSWFLVEEVMVPGLSKLEVEKVRLDLMKSNARQYVDADVLVFNTGHWWTHEKTSRGKRFYQEGEHLHGELSAEKALVKAMNTWANWVKTHVDTSKTRVFFRGYSSSHFGGGKWNKGGSCDGETVPVTDDEQLIKASKLVSVVESVIEEVRSVVTYLNVTRMTEYRKDAHPSKYRPVSQSAGQDCSHWCLPGVPDVWNEMLYAMLAVEV